MNGLNTALMIYVIYFIVAFLISLKYGSFMMKKTGIFIAQLFIAEALNLLLGIIAIIGWLIFSWGVNEFMFLSGLLLGLGLLIVGEIILFTVLFSKRKQLT